MYIQKNTLDCDLSNYSSRIVYCYIPIVGPTGNSDIRPPNMKPNSSQHNTQQEVYRTTCREILSFKFFHMIGRQSVVNILN